MRELRKAAPAADIDRPRPPSDAQLAPDERAWLVECPECAEPESPSTLALHLQREHGLAPQHAAARAKDAAVVIGEAAPRIRNETPDGYVLCFLDGCGAVVAEADLKAHVAGTDHAYVEDDVAEAVECLMRDKLFAAEHLDNAREARRARLERVSTLGQRPKPHWTERVMRVAMFAFAAVVAIIALAIYLKSRR